MQYHLLLYQLLPSWIDMSSIEVKIELHIQTWLCISEAKFAKLKYSISWWIAFILIGSPINLIDCIHRIMCGILFNLSFKTNKLALFQYIGVRFTHWQTGLPILVYQLMTKQFMTQHKPKLKLLYHHSRVVLSWIQNTIHNIMMFTMWDKVMGVTR